MNATDNEVGRRMVAENFRKGRYKGKPQKNNHFNAKVEHHFEMTYDEDKSKTNELICKLCNRQNPVYFYQQDDVLKR